MKVAILGFAAQGDSAYKYWQHLGAEITICDQDESKVLPDGVSSRLGADYLKNLDEFDLLVRTPRLHPQKIVDANPNTPDILAKVTTATNEFLKAVKTPTIGITGTKGKGTTTLLVAEILKKAGNKVVVAGNIGISPLSVLKEAKQADWCVLELSNFQTIDLAYSPSIAICLKITPEHLDWHKDMEEYVEAKVQLVKHQRSQDLVVYSTASDGSIRFGMSSPADKSYSFNASANIQQEPGLNVYIEDNQIFVGEEKIIDIDDIKLPGRHNHENICAAIGATWDIVGKDPQPIIKTLTTILGFENRLEFVRTIDGVDYINDSFSDSPQAAIAAINSFTKPMILILGGHDKKSDYSELIEIIVGANNVKHVLTIGQTGPQIAKMLVDSGYENISEVETKMPKIVATAKDLALPGDIVLLSPASAGYGGGGFKDFFDRGTQFKNSVNSL